MANSSPPWRQTRSFVRTDSRRTWANSRRARSPVSWPWVSLSSLKWSRSAMATAISGSSRAKGGHAVLEGPSVQKAGEAVRCRLQLGLRHDPQQSDDVLPRAWPGSRDLVPCCPRKTCCCAGDMNDADRAAHDGDRHAHGRHGTFWASPKLGAGVEFLAIGEPLHLGPTSGRAMIRRVDAAVRRRPCGRGRGHAQQMRMAVVGQRSSMGASGTMAENDRSITWTTSGSPSAMSSALARRLSNF